MSLPLPPRRRPIPDRPVWPKNSEHQWIISEIKEGEIKLECQWCRCSTHLKLKDAIPMVVEGCPYRMYGGRRLAEDAEFQQRLIDGANVRLRKEIEEISAALKAAHSHMKASAL